MAAADPRPAWSPPHDRPLPPDHTPSGASTGAGNAAAQPEVQVMFDRIAPRYDLMNLLISAFQEPRWRTRLVDARRPAARAAPRWTSRPGTGKVAADLHARVQPGGRVLGVDLSPGMTAVAQQPVRGPARASTYVVGDALALPTEDATFDAATIAFGMRNLPDYRQGFAEMARSVRPGGRVLCLEIARPRSAGSPGSCAGGSTGSSRSSAGSPARARAYGYLVRSVQAYPSPERIAEIMGEAGLVDVTWQGLTGGIVTLHEGTVPALSRQLDGRRRAP